MIRSFRGQKPQLDPSVYVAENASIIGDVHIGAGSSIWFGAVLRGDVHSIRIGKETSIQDNTVIHVTHERFATQVGDFIQTSGVDELFPRGQPVGQVAEVEDVAGDQQRVRVIPAVRFDRLDMVWVVLASAPPPDPAADAARKPPLAAGLGPLK